MTTIHIQDDDIVADATPAITFAGSDETWIISAGVLIVSETRDGIFGGFFSDSVFNNGTIVSGSPSDVAVFLNGGNSFVSNAAGARIIGAGDGIFTNSDPATVQNAGIVEGLGGVGVGFVGDGGQLANTGSIYGRVNGVHWEGLDGTITNSGLITSDQLGFFVATVDGVTTTITNAAGGTIVGTSLGISVDSGRLSLDNSGTVTGGIGLFQDAAENDVIINRGTINGTTFLGTGNDRFVGTGGVAGAVFGAGGDDRLIGGAAVDRLHGGVGLDTLTGGSGRDQFFFDTELNAATNVDRITDFAAGLDRVVLADAIFTAAGPDGALAAARFHIGPVAADAGDRIIYNANTGFLFYDRDGTGGAAQVHFATLAPHLALHNTDFLVAHLFLS